MKKFQVWETNSGTEIGKPFEAKDMEDALSQVLGQHGEAIKEVKEVKDSLPRISIVVQGGLIQDISIPDNVNVVVEVRDYDVEGIDEDRIEKDDDGSECVRSEWSNE